MKRHLRGSSPRNMQRNQRGVMLIIALIVLVAMTLAGIGLMRSVDTATIVAGNISFKQSTVNAADQALQTAWAWLNTNAGSTCLYYDPSNPNGCGQGTGYNSSVPAIDPDWTQAANWTNAAVLNSGNPDAAGNTIYFFIHRMCTTPNSSTTANVCGSTPSNAAINTSGIDQTQANFFTQPPAIHYRITVRAVGPRNSVTIVQTMLRTI